MQGPVSFIKPTFAGGEFSPSLWSRVDIQKYASGARTLRNFTVQPEGGISNRPGTHMKAEAKYPTGVTRVLPFQFSTTQQYVIEAGDEYMRFYTDDGQIVVSSATAWQTATAYVVGDYVSQSGTIYYCIVAHTSGTFATDLAANKWVAQTIYEIPTPYTEDELWNVRYAQSADVLFMACGTVKPKTLSRNGDTDWDIEDYDFQEGPFMLDNTTAVTMTPSGTTGSITLTASAATFDALHVGALWKLRHYIQGQTSSVSITGTGAQTGIKCGGTWRIITHGTWTGKINVEKSTDGGSNWTVIRTFASTNDNNVNTFGEDSNDGDPYLVRINTTAFSSGTANVDLTTDAFYQVGVVKITAYTSSTQVTATVTRTLGLTTATDDWAEGAWSDYRGWPETVVFFQDRLVWGGNRTNPATNWMTETGNYYRFRISSPLVDTDMISVNLPSRQQNNINGLVPLLDLIALTTSGEWTITSSGSSLTPTTTFQKVNGYNGSSGVAPLVIGSRAIYVQSSGSQIRDLGFNLADEGFVGSMISIFSKHLFNGYAIMDMAYQQDPDSVAWFVRNDGKLLSLTYLREQEVLAWAWHDTEGEFESVCTIQGSGYNELWMVVSRDTGKFIERMDQRMASEEPEDQFFVDCGITYHNPKVISGATKANPCVLTITAHGYSNGDLIDVNDVVGMTELNGNRYKVKNVAANTVELTDPDDDSNINSSAYTTYVSGGTAAKAITTVTGLDHLEGLDVAVLGDGSVEGNYDEPLTVTSGQVTLANPCSKVHVGLPYLSDFESLSVDFSGDAGTIQGKKMKVSKVALQLLNSRGGKIGPNFTTMYDLGTDIQLYYDEASPLYTGDLFTTLAGGYETGGRVCIRQSEPLPFQLLSIIPTVTVGGMSTVQ